MLDGAIFLAITSNFAAYLLSKINFGVNFYDMKTIIDVYCTV